MAQDVDGPNLSCIYNQSSHPYLGELTLRDHGNTITKHWQAQLPDAQVR